MVCSWWINFIIVNIAGNYDSSCHSFLWFGTFHSLQHQAGSMSDYKKIPHALPQTTDCCQQFMVNPTWWEHIPPFHFCILLGTCSLYKPKAQWKKTSWWSDSFMHTQDSTLSKKCRSSCTLVDDFTNLQHVQVTQLDRKIDHNTLDIWVNLQLSSYEQTVAQIIFKSSL